MGDPRGTKHPFPDTPFIPSGSDDIPPAPLKIKKENSFTSKCVYIKCPCIKTCFCAAQHSAISSGKYSFFLFSCSFRWHFVKFLTRRGGRLSGMPLEIKIYRQASFVTKQNGGLLLELMRYHELLWSFSSVLNWFDLKLLINRHLLLSFYEKW